MPGANANTQIANLNEENLQAILAAIKVLQKRMADEQRARERLERRSDAAADRYVAALNELTKRVRQYFESKHLDPGGCVSDPPSEHSLCLELGLQVTMPPTDEPWGVREFHLRHPDGHTFRVGAHRIG